MARAVAASRLSTSTITLWVRIVRASASAWASSCSSSVLGFVGTVQADQAVDHDRHEQDDHPRALAELHAGHDHAAPTTTATRRSPLMTRPDLHCGSLWVMWCLAMPAWLSVKLVNTPMAYSGISRLTSPPVASSVTIAAPARKMIPLENTSRWPRTGQLAGHEVVAGVEGGQAGEVGEAGVGRQHQDEHRAGLQRVEQDVPTRRSP